MLPIPRPRPADPPLLPKRSGEALRRLWLILGWLLLTLTPPAWAVPASLVLGGRTPAVDAWPAMRVLFDESGELDATQARARLSTFQVPLTPYANFGPRHGAVWVHVPLQVEVDAPTLWLLRLQYALLHDVDVRVYDRTGELVRSTRLGALIPHVQREQPTRALAMDLLLTPGERYDVLMRIESPTAMLVPLAFMQAPALAHEELQELTWQGFMSGIWFFMALYSLLNALYHRQRSFIAYTAVIGSSWLFAQAMFGVGALQWWRNSGWLAGNLSALSPLLMFGANAAFFTTTLDLRRQSPRVHRALIGLMVSAGLLAGLFAAGLTGYRLTAALAMMLSIPALTLVVPVVIGLIRRGDRPALFMLMGILSNLAAVVLVSLVLRGVLPYDLEVLHGAQVCFALEMATWLMVLAARLEQLRRAEESAQREKESLRRLAHTDHLTGLLNRRGLEIALHERLNSVPADGWRDARRDHAVFLLDLDGFKPVNDQWGHEIGDVLLCEVAQRLRRTVRPTDLVARLGGDEFVVAIDGLSGEEVAAAVGRKLLMAFNQPFDLGDGRRTRVGATIGYATTARHGREAAQLLRQADQAMYAGKQAGKQMLMSSPVPA